MKSLLIFLISLSVVSSISAQNGRMKADGLKGKYEVDDNGYVTYSKVIETPGVSADELYMRALNYFTYHYNDANSVIQTEDKEAKTIVAKGVYVGVYEITLGIDDIQTYHIIRIDTKQERARVINTLTGYKQLISSTGVVTGGWREIPINSVYPVDSKSFSKNFYGKTFYNSHQKVMESFDAIEKALKEGNTTIEADDDW